MKLTSCDKNKIHSWRKPFSVDCLQRATILWLLLIICANNVALLLLKFVGKFVNVVPWAGKSENEWTLLKTNNFDYFIELLKCKYSYNIFVIRQISPFYTRKGLIIEFELLMKEIDTYGHWLIWCLLFLFFVY